MSPTKCFVARFLPILLTVALAVTASANELDPTAVQLRYKEVPRLKTKQRVRLYRRQAELGAGLDAQIAKELGFRPRGLPSARAAAVGARRATKRMLRSGALSADLLVPLADSPSKAGLGIIARSPQAEHSSLVAPGALRIGHTQESAAGTRRSQRSVERTTNANSISWTYSHSSRTATGNTRWIKRHYRPAKDGLVLEHAQYLRNGVVQGSASYLHTADGQRRRISGAERDRLVSSKARIAPRTKAWDAQLLKAAGIQAVTITRGKRAGQTYFRRGPNYDAARARALGLTFVRGSRTSRGYRQAHLRTVGR